MKTIQITRASNNRKYTVSVFDITFWDKNSNGTARIRVPGIESGKVFTIKEQFDVLNAEIIAHKIQNPDGSLLISNRFKWNENNLYTNNEFIIDLWGTGGIHTITLPEGIEFVESRVEDYQFSHEVPSSVFIMTVNRSHAGNVITLEIIPSVNFRREGKDDGLWRGPDWLYGTHAVTLDQHCGKRYIGSFVLKFTATGEFIIPEMQGGYFLVEGLKTPVEPTVPIIPGVTEPGIYTEDKLDTIEDVSGVGPVLAGRIRAHFDA